MTEPRSTTFAVDIYIALPGDAHLEEGIRASAIAHGGRFDYRCEFGTDMTSPPTTIKITYEFDEESNAQAMVEALEHSGERLRVEGPYPYG